MILSKWKDPEVEAGLKFLEHQEDWYGGPGQVAQSVRALSWYTKVAGSIPGQGTYKQPMNE